jgi:hypothetical protein
MSRSRPPLLCALTALMVASGSSAHAGAARAAPPDRAIAPDAPIAPARANAEDRTARGHRRPLPFYYDLYTFRGAGSGTAIVSAFAVEAGELETEPADDGVRYRFSVTLVLADTALRTVKSTHDTVFVDVERPLHSEHLLYTHVEVPARPSDATLQRVIMTDATTPGIGQLYSEYFPIPDYSGSELMLSDVALGKPDVRAGWRRGGVTLALLPTSQFPSGAFDVYYEIYNLPADHAYSTTITIQSAATGAGDPAAVSLRFADESGAGADDVVRELRRVEASLERGRYRITVTIKDAVTGATAVRSRDFEVQGRSRSATMVAALPQAAR